MGHKRQHWQQQHRTEHSQGEQAVDESYWLLAKELVNYAQLVEGLR